MKHLMIAAVVACFSSLSVADAHEGAEGAVKARMDSMSAIGDANRPLTRMSRGQMDFDLETVRNSASIMAENSMVEVLEYFPEGSAGGVSEALPEIWENWEEFSGIMADLNRSAVALSAIESEEEFAALYREVGMTCRSCHRSYRE